MQRYFRYEGNEFISYPFNVMITNKIRNILCQNNFIRSTYNQASRRINSKLHGGHSEGVTKTKKIYIPKTPTV